MKSALLLLLALIPVGLAAQPIYPIAPGGLVDTANLDAIPHYPKRLGFAGDELPPSSSLRAFCPTPQDQGQLATCTGWSVAYGALTILKAKQQGITDQQAIDAMAFDPYFPYLGLSSEEDQDCMAGVLLNEAIEFTIQWGGVAMQVHGLSCTDDLDETMLEEGLPNRARAFYELFGYQDVDREQVVETVKRALHDGNPVLCNILTYLYPYNRMEAQSYEPSFWYVQDRWQPTAREKNRQLSQPAGPHNVVIIGYDDEKYGGAFQVMNSYGSEWGEGGFFWISYDDFMSVKNVAFVME